MSEEVVAQTPAYIVQRVANADGTYLTAACHVCREVTTVPDKGLGRATIGTWKTRHNHDVSAER